MSDLFKVSSSPHVRSKVSTDRIMLYVIIALLPALVTGLLVVPIPNYQNVLCVLISIYNFYTGRRKYVWKGWCCFDGIEDANKK